MHTESFDFGHDGRLDAGVDHLIRLLMDENPTTGRGTQNTLLLLLLEIQHLGYTGSVILLSTLSY